MFKLDVEVCFQNYFVLIPAMLLLLGSIRSIYFFGTPGTLRSMAIATLKSVLSNALKSFTSTEVLQILQVVSPHSSLFRLCKLQLHS